MLEVNFYTKDDGSIRMSMHGHTGVAEKGKDLVCAGATTLAYTLAQVLEFMREEDQLKRKPKLFIDEGEAKIIATPKEEDYAEALHTFFVIQAGMHVLSANYPENIRLTPFGKA